MRYPATIRSFPPSSPLKTTHVSAQHAQSPSTPPYPTLKFNSAGNPFQAIDTESIPPSEFNATVISFPTHRPCQLQLRQIILAIHLTHQLNQTCKRTEQKYNLLVSPTLMDAIYILD
ncbi:hypothetical protein DSO57_1003122 [Entomophthora muscae]|uniref:Uncharacterized protein n=1 Tax=Entomophthora muscae TaxID=34485 RepID=A0ACC2UUJ2_9FUNG|nr:hypothetical protein DSO57_1003122 [Entomophthora muscae]